MHLSAIKQGVWWVRQVDVAGSSPTLAVMLKCLCMGSHHNASRVGVGAMFASFAASCEMLRGTPAPHPISALMQAPPPTHAPLLLPVQPAVLWRQVAGWCDGRAEACSSRPHVAAAWPACHGVGGAGHGGECKKSNQGRTGALGALWCCGAAVASA